MVNDNDKVIAIEVKEDKEIQAHDCNFIGLFGVAEECETHKRLPTTLKLEAQLMRVSGF